MPRAVKTGLDLAAVSDESSVDTSRCRPQYLSGAWRDAREISSVESIVKIDQDAGNLVANATLYIFRTIPLQNAWNTSGLARERYTR